MSNYRIEEHPFSESPFLVLKGPRITGTLPLEGLLGMMESENFKTHNSNLVPIFERAKEMMERGEVGDVEE